MTLEAVWRQLAEDTDPPPAGYLSRRVGVEAPCDIHAALEFPAGARVLLVGVPAGPLRRAGQLPRALGLEVRQVHAGRPRPGTATVAVRLGDARYADVFTVVADDLTRHLAVAPDAAAAAGVLFTRLRKWQEFLDRYPPEGLGPLEQQGLYGELWFLWEILLPAIPAGPAVSGWLGPEATSQDFHLGALAVEVKTSTAKNHPTLAISSARQLDGTGIPHLVLFHLGLDERRESGETLPAVVAHVRQALAADPLAAETFEARLREAGYLDCHAARYAETGYVVRERHFFLVAGDFPRIVEAELRPGVGNVRYTISLAECMHHRIEEAAFHALLGGAQR
jgi:hypothetical protein